MPTESSIYLVATKNSPHGSGIDQLCVEPAVMEANQTIVFVVTLCFTIMCVTCLRLFSVLVVTRFVVLAVCDVLWCCMLFVLCCYPFRLPFYLLLSIL